MKKIVFLLLVIGSAVYGQSYNLTINLKDGSTVTFPVESLQRLEFKNVSGVEDAVKPEPAIQTFKLMQNYPNPFNPSTTIEYQLPGTAPVNVSVYSTHGQLVKELINETQSAGIHRLIWDGSNQNNIRVASGIYIYTIKRNNLVVSKKMILIK